MIASNASAARADWRVVGQVGGSTSAIAVQGRFACVGVGFRLHVYDISNPGEPAEIGSTAPFDDFISDVVILGTRAYVTAGTGGLHILDITDSANPREIGKWDSPGSAEAVAVDGTLAYVADGPFGLQIVDVSNPSAPAPVSAAFDTQFAFDVALQGRYAFIAAAGAGLLVADVSDAVHPRELAILDTPGYARDIAVSGTTLYLADQWGGVRVVNIADPLHPREIGAIPLPSWAFAVATSGSMLYIADGSEGLHLFDVSDPSHPQQLGIYAVPWKLSWKVALAGNRALLGVRTQGVHIVDVSEPSAPRPLSVLSPLANAQALASKDTLAFVATDSQGLRIVDFSDATRPRERGRGNTNDFGWGVAADESRVYTCEGASNPNQFLRVFDVTNPDRPAAVTSLHILQGTCHHLVLKGNSLYIPDEFGLEVFDVSNPARPVPTGLINFPGAGPDQTAGVIGVDVAGSLAFVVNGDDGVKIVDVTDPRNLRVIGAWSQALVQVKDVFFQNGLLYLAAGGPYPQLLILDVKDPTRPVRIGAAAIPALGNRVIVRGSNAYLAAGAAGVAVIDVSNPTAPIQTSRIALPGFALDLILAGGRLLVASSDAGLFILEETSGVSAKANDITSSGGSSGPTGDQWHATLEPILDSNSARTADLRESAALVDRPLDTAGRTIVVTSTADSGPGTLRDAINSLEAGDTITFDSAVFPPGAPATIRPETVLPRIGRDAITIDASNAGVILDGSRVPGQLVSQAGIYVVSTGNTIKGLQIMNFPRNGIIVSGNGRNVIGGDRSRGAGPSGEGNVISLNRQAGITILNPNGNRVVGNLIGTDVTGRRGLGSQQWGVKVFYQPGNGEETGVDRIGGTDPWEANVIAGNLGAEVYLQNTRGHTVAGNFLGTDPTGSVRVGESFTAIATSVAADNLITGNVMIGQEDAIIITDSGSCCNRIVNNWIGVTRSGAPFAALSSHTTQFAGVRIMESFNLVAGNTILARVSVGGLTSTATDTIIIGNKIGSGGPPTKRNAGEGGLNIDASSRTFIGGSTDAERNEIRGKPIGVWVRTVGVDRTFMLGNTIAGNLDGVDLGSAARSFVQGNVIANNKGRGVIVSAATNRLRRNSIYDNADGAVSIDATAAGVPLPPILTAVTSTTVVGAACARCSVEIYSDSGTQGRWYEGMTVADVDGRFAFAQNAVLRGPSITATATNPAGSTSAFSTLATASTFTIADRGGVSSATVGGGGDPVVGYARIQPNAGRTTPSGMAIFSFRSGGITVSEASVPASPLVESGRIAAVVSGPINTGLAIANPNSQPATVSFYFTNESGTGFGAGSTVIPANSQIAKFLDQAPFNPGPNVNGTFTFTSSLPMAITALRGYTNERSEFLITTLPVADLGAGDSETTYFPHFADGGGWRTEIILVNPSDNAINGSMTFYSSGSATTPGAAVNVNFGNQTASTLSYSIPARSSIRFRTAGTASSVQSGSIRVVPASGGRAPVGLAVFSMRNASGVTVSEAGVPAVRLGTAFRLYAESSGDFSSRQIGSTQTGIAITNTDSMPAIVNLELTDLQGTPLGGAGAVLVPANGQIATFLNQIPGLANIPSSFQGVLRISTPSTGSIAAVGLRGRYNERADFLVTTTLPINESIAATTAEMFFPHLVDAGGYTTQFILFSGAGGQSSAGTLRFVGQNGQSLALPVR